MSGQRMPERVVERRLVAAAEARGGMALKLTPAGSAGWPDRLVLLPGGRLCFVELKRPGGRPRPLQLKRHEELRALGFRVEVIDSPEAAEGLCRAL